MKLGNPMNWIGLTISWLMVSSALAKPQDLGDIKEVKPSEKFKTSPKKPEKVTEEDVCLTPGCVHAASLVLKTIDESVDPCEDFYDFACGGYIEETIIPDHKTSRGTFGDLRDRLNEKLRKLYENDNSKNEPTIYKGVRNYYKSCMNENHIEENSKKDAEKVLEQLGGWPVLLGEQWSGDEFDWKTTVEKAAGVGMDQDVIISLGIGTNPSNSTKRMIELDQPSFGLSREYLIKGLDDKDVKAYYKYMVDVAVYMGADQQAAEDQMKQVLEFELDLANMALPKEKRRNKTALFNPMTIAKAGELLEDDFNLTSHINMLFENILSERSVAVADEEVVNVAVPAYLKNLTQYLPKVDKRIQANYMMWRYLKGLTKFMDNQIYDIKLEYSKVITGQKQRSPRWETCVKSVSGTDSSYLYFYEGSLTNVVGAMYAKKHFPLSRKSVADSMVDNIRKEFKIMLDEITWMDEKTKERAHKKADLMKSWIAYAEEILDDKLLEEFYQGLELSSSSYMNNFLALKKFINAYYVNHYRLPIDKASWKTHGGSAIVNAFYSSEENSIQFPAGILSGVFFEADRPLYMNYGAIGMVVGHEITHGFDDQGSQKDGLGNLVDWWEPDTKKNYLKKAKCIIDQYAAVNVTIKYDNGDEDEILSLNGINTQGENIADNGGVKEAQRAYKRLEKEVGKEPLLPGLKYNQNQLFWISTANIWCDTRRPAKMKQQILTDPHSPTRYRVNIPLANNPQFALDFKCPKGSKMNPETRCEVW